MKNQITDYAWLGNGEGEAERDYANVAAVEENKSCAIAREKTFHVGAFTTCLTKQLH